VVITDLVHKASNQSMKPTAPIAMQVPRVCHDILPWLISISLDGMNGCVESGELELEPTTKNNTGD
jgi:hypothetical protein